MTTPTTIPTSTPTDLVVINREVRINDPGLPPGHALKVTARTPAECLRLARAYEMAAGVLRELGVRD